MSLFNFLFIEDGIATHEDAHRLRAAGADALLVGETLMRSGDVVAAINELVE